MRVSILLFFVATLFRGPAWGWPTKTEGCATGLSASDHLPAFQMLSTLRKFGNWEILSSKGPMGWLRNDVQGIYSHGRWKIIMEMGTTGKMRFPNDFLRARLEIKDLTVTESAYLQGGLQNLFSRFHVPVEVSTLGYERNAYNFSLRGFDLSVPISLRNFFGRLPDEMTIKSVQAVGELIHFIEDDEFLKNWPFDLKNVMDLVPAPNSYVVVQRIGNHFEIWLNVGFLHNFSDGSVAAEYVRRDEFLAKLKDSLQIPGDLYLRDGRIFVYFNETSDPTAVRLRIIRKIEQAIFFLKY